MTLAWWSRPASSDLAATQTDWGLTVCGPDLAERQDAEVIFAGGEPYDAEVLAGLEKAIIIARVGIGYDAVDLDAATERGVLVTNTPEGPTTSTAEHTIALMMAVTHELTASALRLRNATGDYIGKQGSMELSGQTVGLLGLGRIGRAVAIMAQGIGMKVIATDPALTNGSVDGIEIVELAELFERSDVLSIHAPATPATTGLVDADAFAAMKPGSVLINCARGSIVNTDDLVASLESGHLMGAGLDVTEPEPLDPSHPLLHMDNVIVTPHIASSTVAGRRRMNEMALEQVSMALRHEIPTHLLNPSVLTNPNCALSQ